MITITLHIKPLSVNAAFQGRRFSTPEKTAYETRLRWSIPKVAVVGNPYYKVEYDFYLKNFALTDWDNCVKITQDCLVKKGVISDDRLIVHAVVRKFPTKSDKIVIRIEACTLEGDEMGTTV